MTLPEATPKDKLFAGQRLLTFDEIREHRGTCIVLSGKPGVGKTTLAATAANSDIAVPLLHLDIESGGHVINTPKMFTLPDGSEIPVIQPIEVKEFVQVERIIQQLLLNPKPFNGCILDNFSELLSLCQKKHNFYGLAEKDRYSAWNKITDDMLDVTRNLRNLARNRRFVSIIVMWDTAESEVDPAGNVTRKYRDVQLTPKLAEKFKGIVDVMGYVERPDMPQKPYPPVLRFDIDPTIPTKMRISPQDKALLELPDIIYQPDLGDIINTTLGGMPWPADKHKKR